jgi:hypothetical protein
VTGARKGTSHDAIYRETGWPTLSDRRKAYKLKTFIKIITDEAPEYLCQLIPERLGQLMPASRHGNNFQLLRARTETFYKVFFHLLLDYGMNSHRKKDLLSLLSK